MIGGTTIPITHATKVLLRMRRLKASVKFGRELTWDEFLKKTAGT